MSADPQRGAGRPSDHQGAGQRPVPGTAPRVDDWPTAAEWLSSSSTDPGALVVAGMPLAAHAVTPSRYDLAPAAVRQRLGRLSTLHGELGIDVRRVPVRDLGDSLDPPGLDAPLTVVLGGHNGVTHRVLAAASPPVARWGLLTLDAHHDVRPYERGAVGNGSPVRALLDAGLPGSSVVQVGITGFSNSPVHRAWCEDRGITVLGPSGVDRLPDLLDALAARADALYVDLDVDVLDAAFAPGCPGARPGGLPPRALFAAAFAAGAHPAVRAIDLVEVDPTRDAGHRTVDAVALALLHAAAGFSTRD